MSDLESMTKAQLRALAEGMGLIVSKNQLKCELIEEISNAKAGDIEKHSGPEVAPKPAKSNAPMRQYFKVYVLGRIDSEDHLMIDGRRYGLVFDGSKFEYKDTAASLEHARGCLDAHKKTQRKAVLIRVDYYEITRV